MKKCLITIMLNILFLNSFSQKTDGFFPIGCLRDVHPDNNDTWIIHNFRLTPNTIPWNVQEPFGFNQVEDWTYSHGSPQLINGSGFGFPSDWYFASMWANKSWASNSNKNSGEGIIGSLTMPNTSGHNHATVTGHKYVLSFYRKVTSEPNLPSDQLDEIDIVLLKCQEALSLMGGGFTTPDLPVTGCQRIYRESAVSTIDHMFLEQIVMEFTADDEYDAIWIYPRQKITSGQAWLTIGGLNITSKDALVEGPYYVCPNSGGPGTTILCNQFTDNWVGLHYGGMSGLSTSDGGYFGARYEWFDNNSNVIATKDEGTSLEFACNSSYCNWMGHVLYGTNPIPSPLDFTYQISFPNAIIPNSASTYSVPFVPVPRNYTVNKHAIAKDINSLDKKMLSDDNIFFKKLSYNASSKSILVTPIFEYTNTKFNIEIYDEIGRLIEKVNNVPISGNENRISFKNELKAGLYIIRFYNNFKVFAKKIFIENH